MKNLSIHYGCYADKIDKDLPFNEYGDEKITGNFTVAFDCCCDRSDLACLNIEHQNGILVIVEEITDFKNNHHYTHIVKDSNGQYFAVQFNKGDWLERF